MKKSMIYLLSSLMVSTTLWAGWIEADKIVQGSGDENLSFGHSIDIDGDYAIVGAPDEFNGNGAVYIYKKDINGNFTPFQELKSIQKAYDYSTSFYNGAGSDVAVSDDGGNHVSIAIGAPETRNYYYPVYSTTYYDSVVVFDLNVTSNRFEFSDSFDEVNGSGAGMSVDAAYIKSTTGTPPNLNIITIGTIVSTGLPTSKTVKTYAHNFATGDWNTTELIYSGDTLDEFGHCVALRNAENPWLSDSAAKLIVGAPKVDVGGNTDRGSAYIYMLSGSLTNGLSWSNPATLAQIEPVLYQTGEYLNSNTEFGTAVDITGNRAIVGAKLQNTSFTSVFNENRGEAIVYELTDAANNLWEPMDYALRSSTVDEKSDGFGLSVAIEEDLVIIGAPRFDDAANIISGTVFSFDYNSSEGWNETGMLKGSAEGQFGHAIDITTGTPVVGDPENDTVSILKYRENSGTSSALIMYLLN